MARHLVISVTSCSVFRAKLSLLPSPGRLADDAMSMMSLFELADRFNEPRIRFLNESTLQTVQQYPKYPLLCSIAAPLPMTASQRSSLVLQRFHATEFPE
jgi:hypothetical protein